jgi:hypothetical protein
MCGRKVTEGSNPSLSAIRTLGIFVLKVTEGKRALTLEWARWPDASYGGPRIPFVSAIWTLGIIF